MNKEKLLTIIIFILLLTGWASTFVLGTFIDSGEFVKELLSADNDVWQRIGAFIGILGSWTWSNILILCCLSALLGEFGRIAMGNSRNKNIMGALVRGFFIFLFLTVGQLVITGSIPMPQAALPEGSTDMATTAESYRRLGGMCSLFGFTIGYKPEFLDVFLNRILRDEKNGNDDK